MSSSLMPDKLENISQPSLHLPKQWIQILPPFLYFAQQDFHSFLEKKKKRLKRVCFGIKYVFFLIVSVVSHAYIPQESKILYTSHFPTCPVWDSSSKTFLKHMLSGTFFVPHHFAYHQTLFSLMELSLAQWHWFWWDHLSALLVLVSQAELLFLRNPYKPETITV